MNREEQIQSYDQIQEYLQKNNIYQTFSQLVQQIILEKPTNPLDFIISQLQKPQNITLFVIGPPGLSINSIIRKALVTSNKNFQVFNFGEELLTIQKLLSEQQKEKLKRCKLVRNEQINSLIDQVQKYAKSQKNFIIEGFPKNLSQALILQKRGVYARNVLIINVDILVLRELIMKKIESTNSQLTTDEKLKLVEESVYEHNININEVKRFYNQYMEIDLSGKRDQQYIIKQLDKAISLKTIQPVPRVTTQILIVGAPFSGRTTLGKKVAQHYGLVYISTSSLISEEIRRETIQGRKVQSHYLNNQLIDSFLIEKLIEDRITKKDCRMQGFVLEGYPKTPEQLDNLKNMKLDLTMIVGIDIPKQTSLSRSNISKQKFDLRFLKWEQMSGCLKQSKQKIFWVNPNLSIGNSYEEVVHQLEKKFI